jgi:sulfofructose kinase
MAFRQPADHMTHPTFDLVGVGLNATDTLIKVAHFPAYGGKVPIEAEIVSPGGQVASALTAVAKLGKRVKYIGTVGDDERGRIQLQSLRETGINLDDVEVRENCPNQMAYIVIDESTGERTVFWSRAHCLTLDPDTITAEKIGCARMLHIDGHDTPAVEKAARVARELHIPVSVDVDTIYPGFDRVLGFVDYLISSSEFPVRWTNENDPFRALEMIQNQYGMRIAAMTLGAHGALARIINEPRPNEPRPKEAVKTRDSMERVPPPRRGREGARSANEPANARFVYSPGFVVDCVDTTGAGDVFHGAFCYAVLEGMPIGDTLEFSNAMAALNCTRLGARGGIGTLGDARALIERAERRSHHDFSSAARRA